MNGSVGRFGMSLKLNVISARKKPFTATTSVWVDEGRHGTADPDQQKQQQHQVI